MTELLNKVAGKEWLCFYCFERKIKYEVRKR